MEIKKYHFVGIGGIGMSAIASILLQKGVPVSGSDMNRNKQVEKLEALGAEIKIGHFAENITGSDVLVVSSAISIHNPEVRAAVRLGIPVLHRSEVLALLMRESAGIAIGGTHGKTTTTSMVALTLHNAGLDPTAIIGGVVDQFQSNARFGNGEHLVAEADESDGSLVRLSPKIAVITNIEADHMDYYTDIDAIKKTFVKFLQQLPEDGLAVLCTDDPNIKSISQNYTGRKLTYGLTNGANVKAVDINFGKDGSDFMVIHHGLEIGRFQLRVPGRHNVCNSLVAIGIALELGIDTDTIRRSLLDFNGAKRRFQIIAQADDITVVDDYAHHPTEIKATLSAARSYHNTGRIISVFQPHRYTRTQYFHDLYGQSFFNSDRVIVTDIYSAGEKPIPQISGELIAESLRRYGHQDVVYIPDINDVPEYILSVASADDLVITLGAGDVWKVAKNISDKITTPEVVGAA